MKHKDPAIAKLQTQYEKSLYDAIAQIDSPELARAFLMDLCTPAEWQAMVDRWCAAAMLAQGKTQREIAASAGVSVTTVSRVARCLQNPDSGYQQLLNKMQD